MCGKHDFQACKYLGIIFVNSLFRTGFAVVEFMETSEVELVPGFWFKDKKTCLWPSEWKFAKIATAIRQKAAYDDSFNAIRVKLLYETGKYTMIK